VRDIRYEVCVCFLLLLGSTYIFHPSSPRPALFFFLDTIFYNLYYRMIDLFFFFFNFFINNSNAIFIFIMF
jgi:hypothetical protein